MGWPLSAGLSNQAGSPLSRVKSLSLTATAGK